ncbi:MAG: GldG family protein, partial [Chloroflexota bacterium]|nr:GldG family protein [Chloroflexota bacterium]
VAFLRVENQTSRQQAEDLLREYSTRNRKLTYEIVDPFRQPARAVGFGITREGVVVFTDGQKREIANSITEREFTSAIVRLGQNNVNTVAFLTGHGERDINGFEAQSYSTARESLEQNNFRTLTWSLVTSPTLTVSDVTVLVIAEPQQAIRPQEIQTIQGYLDGGGHLLVIMDPAMSPEAQKPLHDLLTPYGLEPVQGVALDPSIQLDPSDASILGPDTYPSTDITTDLERNRLRTAFLASLGFKEGTPKAGYQIRPVVRTAGSAPQSWLETTLSGTTQPTYNEGADLPGPVTLAGLVEPADPASGTVTDTNTVRTRIVAFGDADFASNNILQQQLPLYNVDLFGNTVSYLAGASELVSIRPKDPATPRTVALDAGQRNLVLIGTVLGLPLLVALAGVMMWWRRR